MQAEERQQRLEEYLNEVEFASLDELARQVGASISSVRRDLTALEEKGNVRRTHGGGRIVNPRSDEFSFSIRDTHQASEKDAIGRACAELILPNQSLVLDAGTTVFHVAKYLGTKSPQIVTNSLPVANLFLSANQVEVVVSGGVLYPRLGVLVGPLAVKTFSDVHVDVAIMGAGGLTMEGITNSHALLIEIQRAMIRAAQKVIICMDSSKFGRRSMVPMCELELIDTVVTDSGAPEEIIIDLRTRGIEVVVAGKTEKAVEDLKNPESNR